MSEASRRLKWLSQRLDKLSEPKERSILPNAKTKEAQNLADKVWEIQKLIDRMEDPTERYVLQGDLDEAESCRREIINPTITFQECYC